MADWYIVDGNLPYLNEFPTMHSIDDAPLSVWRIVDGELPFKNQFPEMKGITDAPMSMWRIVDGELPFKLQFPKMPSRPRKEKPSNARIQTIILKDYDQEIIIKNER